MKQPSFPLRRTGNHHDTLSMYCHDTPASAREAYIRAVQHLYNVNHWRKLNDAVKTDFLLCDARGQALDRPARTGDLIRIDVVGPGSPSGGGYDWVSIQQLEEVNGDTPYAAMTVVPCPGPQSDDPAVAHFFAEGATNTFVVRRLGNCVLAEVHGRNERPNTDAPPLLDRVRNEAVALLGTVGLSKIQWKDWTAGVVSVVEVKPQG
ncbi:hypothetical protein [Lewinella sp. JB7]|uniref:hypothetical protein n=1 Tax=Lewinella sp. JB7 TaxID=2962887 RepID=UPI0020C9FFFE|nr:hypothetical protein [Lewinella sp. JB7]MCP9234980.1 hypothetical protein [Lewinella sp. JB7]